MWGRTVCPTKAIYSISFFWAVMRIAAPLFFKASYLAN